MLVVVPWRYLVDLKYNPTKGLKSKRFDPSCKKNMILMLFIAVKIGLKGSTNANTMPLDLYRVVMAT